VPAGLAVAVSLRRPIDTEHVEFCAFEQLPLELGIFGTSNEQEAAAFLPTHTGREHHPFEYGPIKRLKLGQALKLAAAQVGNRSRAQARGEDVAPAMLVGRLDLQLPLGEGCH
jgi:hypothetical protein